MGKKEKLIEKLKRGSITAAEARLLLKHFGYKHTHTRGSHEYYMSDSGELFVLATHTKDLKMYLIRDLRKLLLGD